MPKSLSPGQVIYLARKSQKMSQESLGKLLGLERGAISDLEKGKKSSLSFQQFTTLYREFSLTPNEILEIHPSPDAVAVGDMSAAIERAALNISKLLLKEIPAKR